MKLPLFGKKMLGSAVVGKRQGNVLEWDKGVRL